MGPLYIFLNYGEIEEIIVGWLLWLPSMLYAGALSRLCAFGEYNFDK